MFLGSFFSMNVLFNSYLFFIYDFGGVAHPKYVILTVRQSSTATLRSWCKLIASEGFIVLNEPLLNTNSQ